MASKSINERRRELREQYSSKRFYPLNREKAHRFHSAALEGEEPKERFVGLGLLYTGMRNGEFCHMRRDWIESKIVEGQRLVRIDVPFVELCTGGSGPTGPDNAQGVNLHERGVTCQPCRQQGRDHWIPKTENGCRQITVKEPEAVDIIEWWFDQNEAVPMMHNAVNRRVEKIAERAGIERDITAHDLRDTFATMLVRQGFDRHPVRDLMGHNDIARLNDYYQFVGKDQEEAFLRKWDCR
jgi:integrase